MQDGRAVRHSVVSVHHRRQNFVVHIYERGCFLGEMLACRGDRGNGMPHVQSLFARHDIAAEKAVVDRSAFLLVDELCRRFGEVGGGNDRVDARQRERAAGVDAANVGVGVRAANHLRVQQTRHGGIGGVSGASRNLVHAVVPHGPRPHDLELFVG